MMCGVGGAKTQRPTRIDCQCGRKCTCGAGGIKRQILMGMTHQRAAPRLESRTEPSFNFDAKPTSVHCLARSASRPNGSHVTPGCRQQNAYTSVLDRGRGSARQATADVTFRRADCAQHRPWENPRAFLGSFRVDSFVERNRRAETLHCPRACIRSHSVAFDVQKAIHVLNVSAPIFLDLDGETVELGSPLWQADCESGSLSQLLTAHQVGEISAVEVPHQSCAVGGGLVDGGHISCGCG
mmetsp:Transcript_31636/g.87334  ORF Transcript_31636/g.87334 Transcript_31636/m.87334 type:complete len:240 (+) Transcript_31636:112-831(+)